MKFKDVVKQAKFRSPQSKVAFNIIYTSNWLEEVGREFLKPHGISGEQYNVLRILRGNHPEAYALQEIRDRMLNRWSNVSRLVEKLRKKGYLDRQPMEENRRKVEITITEEGLEFLDRLEELPIAGDFYDKGLSSDEAKQLNTLLNTFRENLGKVIEEQEEDND